jgi:hypothetical protein
LRLATSQGRNGSNVRPPSPHPTSINFFSGSQIVKKNFPSKDQMKRKFFSQVCRRLLGSRSVRLAFPDFYFASVIHLIRSSRAFESHFDESTSQVYRQLLRNRRGDGKVDSGVDVITDERTLSHVHRAPAFHCRVPESSSPHQ